MPEAKNQTTLLHPKWIITCEEDNAILEDHTLVIKDKKIESIVPRMKALASHPQAQQIELATHALLPGFINAHTHCAMSLFRGLADDLLLMAWLNDYIWPAEGTWVSEEFVFDGTQLAIAEMIRSGTTCFNDMYFFLDATARAATAAHIRAHIGMTIIGVPTAWAKTTAEYFAKAEDFYQEYKNNPLIIPTLAPHSTYTLEMPDLVKVNQMAQDYHLKINIHLQESPEEITQAIAKYNKRPLQRLNEIGMVNTKLIAIHMTQINEADIAILIANKPSIVNCPESNMKLASGNCPVEQLRQQRINVALGTDGAASNNDLDMIGEMRSAAFIGKVVAGDPRAVNAEYALKMATINGAKALGIDHYTGSLKPGKAADIIAINLDDVSTQPVYHPISQVVYAASRQQVSDVWVAGKRVLKNRELTTLDQKELIAKAQSWRNKIKK